MLAVAIPFEARYAPPTDDVRVVCRSCERAHSVDRFELATSRVTCPHCQAPREARRAVLAVA